MTLRELRQSLSLSQTEFGERLNVSASMLSQWESDTRTPSSTTLMRIVAEFGCTAHITENGVFFLPPGEWTPPPPPPEGDPALGTDI